MQDLFWERCLDVYCVQKVDVDYIDGNHPILVSTSAKI